MEIILSVVDPTKTIKELEEIRADILSWILYRFYVYDECNAGRIPQSFEWWQQEQELSDEPS